MRHYVVTGYSAVIEHVMNVAALPGIGQDGGSEEERALGILAQQNDYGAGSSCNEICRRFGAAVQALALSNADVSAALHRYRWLAALNPSARSHYNGDRYGLH